MRWKLWDFIIKFISNLLILQNLSHNPPIIFQDQNDPFLLQYLLLFYPTNMKRKWKNWKLIPPYYFSRMDQLQLPSTPLEPPFYCFLMLSWEESIHSKNEIKSHKLMIKDEMMINKNMRWWYMRYGKILVKFLSFFNC